MKNQFEILPNATSNVLGKPLATSDYLKGLDQFQRVPNNFNNEFWTYVPYGSGGEKFFTQRLTDFRPTITDSGICSTFNAPLITDVFKESSVSEFSNVFLAGLYPENVTLVSADIKEYSFILDMQSREHYPFHSTKSRNLAK